MLSRIFSANNGYRTGSTGYCEGIRVADALRVRLGQIQTQKIDTDLADVIVAFLNGQGTTSAPRDWIRKVVVGEVRIVVSGRFPAVSLY
jgi:hypothetical protein